MANRDWKPRKRRMAKGPRNERRPQDRRGPPRHRRDVPRFEQRILTPTAWTSKGEVSLPDNGVAFGGIPGETATFTVRPGRNRPYGNFERAREPSPVRVEPPCDRFVPCGGCPMMHVSAQGQADARVELLRNALRSQGLEIEPDPMVASPDGQFGYRHVVKLIAGMSDQGHPRLGAPARHTRRIVPIPDCHVVTPELQKLTRSTAAAMIDLEIWPYRPERGGLLRYVHARQSRATGEILLTLVAQRRANILLSMADRIANENPQLVGVHLHLNDRDDNAIFDRDDEGAIRTQCLFGAKFIEEGLADVRYRVGPTDFFQTNPGVADQLYRDVIELSEVREGVPVVDLYSGVGGFALALAPRAGWAIGVETQLGAVRTARAAASASSLPAEFVADDVMDALPQIQRRLGQRRPLVIVDPARRGLEDGVADAIRSLNPRRVIYVSCAPVSGARDIKTFVDAGWTLTRVRPYDMFPHTAHMEVVAVLDPPGGSPTELGKRGPRRKIVKR